MRRSVEIKAEVVSGDEREAGRRAILNAGPHRGARARAGDRLTALPHGEAVALGLVAEARWRSDSGVAAPGHGARVGGAARAARPSGPRCAEPLATDALIAAMASDKKNRAGAIRFALPERHGSDATPETEWTVAAAEADDPGGAPAPILIESQHLPQLALSHTPAERHRSAHRMAWRVDKVDQPLSSRTICDVEMCTCLTVFFGQFLYSVPPLQPLRTALTSASYSVQPPLGVDLWPTSVLGKLARCCVPAPSGAFDQYLLDIQKLPMITDPEEEKRLARRALAGDETAAERLVTANLRFVISYVKKYQGHGLDLSELVAIGNEGLLKAVRKFDPDHGVKFISYAVWWVRQAVLKALAEQTRSVRIPLNQNSALVRMARAAELPGPGAGPRAHRRGDRHRAQRHGRQHPRRPPDDLDRGLARRAGRAAGPRREHLRRAGGRAPARARSRR